jgi:hypothetical protein
MILQNRVVYDYYQFSGISFVVHRFDNTDVLSVRNSKGRINVVINVQDYYVDQDLGLSIYESISSILSHYLGFNSFIRRSHFKTYVTHKGVLAINKGLNEIILYETDPYRNDRHSDYDINKIHLDLINYIIELKYSEDILGLNYL